MEQEDFAMLNQESGDGPGSNQGTTTTDDYDVHLPAYLSYLFGVQGDFNSDHHTDGWVGNLHNQNNEEFTQGP